MKTLEELYEEILASDELKKQFAAAVKASDVEGFMKANGCEATLEEAEAFLAAKKAAAAEKEVSVDELDNVAGGGCGADVLEVFESVALSTLSLGTICIALYG